MLRAGLHPFRPIIRLAATLGLLALLAPVSWASVTAAPAPPDSATPQATQGGTAPAEFWVQNHMVTELWSGPDEHAQFFGWLRKFSYLRVERWVGERLYVFNPRTNNFAYVDAKAVGPSGPPPADYLAPIRELAKIDLPGRLVGTTPLYAEPAADDAVWQRDAGHNTPVWVEAKVTGDGGEWYRLDSGEFVQGDHLRLPPPPSAHYSGKWIDVDLNDPTVVTAYEGDRPVASALAIRGVAAWRTPVGTFRILRRVANETMSSEGLGIPRNAPGGYYLENVLFTQYFTGDGASLHYNYWSSNFGYPGSHGCLGLSYEDALWFWNWAELGTPIVIHY